MGIYQYTMRKDAIVVDGMKIGRFQFAYKYGRDWQPGGDTDTYIWFAKTRTSRMKKNRAVICLESAAKRARETLPDVEYFVSASSFNEAKKYKLEVHRCNVHMDQYCEELVREIYPVVGYLTKIGRSYILEKVETHSAVAQSVEHLTVNQSVPGSSPGRGATF